MDFEESDPWLSDIFINKIQRFNFGGKRNNENTSSIIPDIENQNQQIDDNISNLKKHTFESNGGDSERDNVGYDVDFQNQFNINSETITCPADYGTFNIAGTNSETPMSTNIDYMWYDFTTREEELQILEYLESYKQTHTKSEYSDNELTEKLDNSDNELTEKLDKSSIQDHVQCVNCSNVFIRQSFHEHICDHDNNGTLIASKEKISKKFVIAEFDDPACIHLHIQNQIRTRRFFKDELEYDLATDNDNSKETNTSTSECLNECTECDRKFVHRSSLLRHMEMHKWNLIPSQNSEMDPLSTRGLDSCKNNYRVVLKCTFCGRIFFDPQKAYNHAIVMHFDEEILKGEDKSLNIPYEIFIDDACDYLRREFKEINSDSIDNTKVTCCIKSIILNCVLQCEFCDFFFSDVQYLLAHTACHPPRRRFECFACEISCQTSKEILMHWQVDCIFMRELFESQALPIPRFYVCNICQRKFPTMQQLHKHRYATYHFFPRAVRNSRLFEMPCEYCEQMHDDAGEAVKHYQENHMKNKPSTEDGNDGNNNNMKSRPFLCEFCGKTYIQSSHLLQHLRFHRGIKPFACTEEGCDLSFTIRPDLDVHIRKCHTGDRPYKCLKCGKSFLTSSVFYQHRLVHNKERCFKCDICGKSFYRSDVLKNHQLVHTGEKPFGCLFCTKRFRQRGDRVKHTRTRHPQMDANSGLTSQMQEIQIEKAACVDSLAESFINMPYDENDSENSIS